MRKNGTVKEENEEKLKKRKEKNLKFKGKKDVKNAEVNLILVSIIMNPI